METTNLYKEDFVLGRWLSMIFDLGLPSDTDEICVKAVTHMTKSKRKETREKENADSHS